MEFRQVIERRHTVRSYRTDPVPEAALARIREAVQRAPSAGNLQAYRVVVVTGQSARRTLARAAMDQRFIEEAPVSLVFFADPARSAQEYGPRGEQLYALQDATIAATYAMLASVDEGLACGWVGSFDSVQVRSACGEGTLMPVAILPIGYPAEAPAPTARRRSEELFRTL